MKRVVKRQKFKQLPTGGEISVFQKRLTKRKFLKKKRSDCKYYEGLLQLRFN
jgi:hypothetical protein